VTSAPAVRPPAAPAPEPCSSCDAPLAADQRYCLHCGEPREGARRPLPAQPRGETHAGEEGAVAVARDPVERTSVAATLAGLACLLLAMGVGVLIGRGGGATPAAQAPITIAAQAAPATPAAASFTSDWPAGRDGWTVALTLLPKAAGAPEAVARAKRAATGKGAPAVGALDSDAYPSLSAGSYVVYSGVFTSERAAAAASRPLAASFPDARVVHVGRGATATSAPANAPKSTAGGSSGSAAKQAARKAAADTTKAFETSKKAPKTVGTGGKPPPKDNKPAAAGGGFQEIG
jgi:hypothetical protein